MMHFFLFLGKVRPKIQTLLDSLTELSKLLYLPANLRSPKLVLRLHNQAFLHAMILKEVIVHPKSLTERKLYGRYWHSITVHAAKQSRIISLKSTNTEEEERHFNTLQGVTKLTNRRPGDIITPSLVRLQAEQKLAESKSATSPVKMQESQISKYYSTLPPFPNTIIPNRYIIRNPKEYQAHLESISDFIACGEGEWWHQVLSGVEFYDGPDEANNRPQGPTLHHVRSSTLQLEEQHLKENWERCLSDDNITIPHRIIRIYNQRGDCTRVMHTNFLDTENDDNSLQIQEERENETAEDSMTDFLEMEDNENTVEVTGLEEITTPEVEDLLVECSDDENDDEELQPLKTSVSLSPAVRESTSRYNQDQNVNGSEESERCSPETSQQSEKSLSHDRGDSPQQKEIITKLCKNVARIVGETDCIFKLDSARQKMKKNPESEFYRNNYQNLLAPVQTQILAHHTALEKQHKEWEKQHYHDHNCSEPSLEDLKRDKEQYSRYKNLVLCKELLKYWKVTVHL